MIKKFAGHLETSLSSRSIRNYRIGLLVFIISAAVFINWCWNNAQKKENIFLRSLNLEVSLKVLDVKPTGNHGYGVIYGQVTKSNKPPFYSATYNGLYPFCKIKGNEILLVLDYYIMQKTDSVVVNSSKAKYYVYRKGYPMSEYNLTNTTDQLLYDDLKENRYLEFDTYKR